MGGASNQRDLFMKFDEGSSTTLLLCVMLKISSIEWQHQDLEHPRASAESGNKAEARNLRRSILVNA